MLVTLKSSRKFRQTWILVLNKSVWEHFSYFKFLWERRANVHFFCPELFKTLIRKSKNFVKIVVMNNEAAAQLLQVLEKTISSGKNPQQPYPLQDPVLAAFQYPDPGYQGCLNDPDVIRSRSSLIRFDFESFSSFWHLWWKHVVMNVP